MFNTQRLLVFLFCILINFNSFAQISNGGSVFNTDYVHEVRLYFSQKNYWESLMLNYQLSNDTVLGSGNAILANVKIDGINLDSIGVSLKGKLSFTIPTDKKPFKLDFNEFVNGKKFDGLLNLNLSNEFPDPSMLRNTVAYRILSDAGIQVPRTSFAKVFVNEVYWGLYVLTEQIDRTFISERFKNNMGELIKPNGAYLFWEARDTLSFWKNYEIKSKKSSEAYSRLIAFAKKINTTPAIVFYDSLKTDFDFDSFLPVFASDVIFNNTDGYFFGHNYYLYRDNVENKYYFLPWDYNLTLNSNDKDKSGYSILPGGENDDIFTLPLTSKIIANDKLRKMYLDEIVRINQALSGDSLEKYIHAMHDLIRPLLLNDSLKGMSMNQFEKSLTEPTGIAEMDFEGLLTFIHSRTAEIYKMLKEAGYNQDDAQHLPVKK